MKSRYLTIEEVELLQKSYEKDPHMTMKLLEKFIETPPLSLVEMKARKKSILQNH